MPGTSKPRIVLVDDDPDVVRSLGKLLTSAGYVVVQATNGAEAMRMWREGKVGDLVILDLFMPEQDGLETIVELHTHSPNTPIIAISGGGPTGRIEALEDAKRLGAVATLKKPFNPRDLLAVIALELSRRS